MRTMNMKINEHQKLIKSKIEELTKVQQHQKDLRAVRDLMFKKQMLNKCRKTEALNDKCLRYKMKMWIYLHNRDEENTLKYLKKYQDLTVERIESDRETLETDENVILMNSTGIDDNEKTNMASKDKGGDNFILREYNQMKEQFDNFHEYFRLMRLNGMWKTKPC